MRFTPSPNFAEHLARRMHHNQLDKAGAPYVDHLETVASHFLEGSYLWQVAWLHDIVEDTDITLNNLYTLSFPNEVINGVRAISKGVAEDRRTYIKRVAANQLAVEVKYRDLEHNLQEDRHPVFFVSEGEKYREKLLADQVYLAGILRGMDDG
jgi:(p)ppGpp synthase/HD superfamily hydrolase